MGFASTTVFEVAGSQFVLLSYFLIRFAQTKITVFIFFNNWVSKGKQKFSASRTVFSCNALRASKVTIFLSLIYLYLYRLYRSNTTYFGISLRLALNSWWQQLLGKTYGLRYQNGAMVSDSFAYRKTKSCRQHDLFFLRTTYWV